MNIEEIIKAGESQTVEFKKSFNKEAIETVVAFSNSKGGMLFLGISDNGTLHGISLGTETLKEWGNQISQVTEPTVIAEFQIEEFNGKQIVIIIVNEYPLKPVSIRGRCFRRVSNSNRQMSPQEIAQMHLMSTGTSWDALTLSDKSVEDIDIAKVNEYINLSVKIKRRNFLTNENPIEILEKLELLKRNNPTMAAILLFGKSPQSPLTQAKVHCGRFKNDIKIIDDRLIDGSIITQVDEVMDFMRKHINVEFVITGKPQRDEIWDYPLDALREAVINSICHRDYSDTADIQIKIFNDSIQIWNPGGLPFDLTIEDLLNPVHSSKPRNKLIAQVFYDISIIERYGSGIQRMINECSKAGLPAPVFEEKFGGFIITFKKDVLNESYLNSLGFNERQIKCVLHIKMQGTITNQKYRELFNISDRLARFDLKGLCDKRILEKIGGEKGRGIKYLLYRK